MAREKAVPTMSFHLLARGRVGSGNLHSEHRGGVVAVLAEGLEGSGMAQSLPTLQRMGVVVSRGMLALQEGDSGVAGKSEVFSRLEEEEEEGKLSGR